MKVLDTIGLARDVGGIPLRKIIECNSDDAFLGEMDFTSLRDRYGFSPIGIRRFVLQQRLRDAAVRQDVPVFQGWELDHVRETQDAVVAVAKDKREIAASFVIGCDGIHSATRRLVLQKHGRSELAADHTGQVAVCAFVFGQAWPLSLIGVIDRWTMPNSQRCCSWPRPRVVWGWKVCWIL